MERAIFLIVSLAGLFLLQSCKDKDLPIDGTSASTSMSLNLRSDLVARMKADPLVVAYNSTVDKMFMNLVYNKHEMANFSKRKAREQIVKLQVSPEIKNGRSTPSNVSLKACATAYSNAGMKNSTEYLTLIRDMIYYKARIENKYPQLRTMKPSESRIIFEKTHAKPANKVDLALFSSRRPGVLKSSPSLDKFIKKTNTKNNSLLP